MDVTKSFSHIYVEQDVFEDEKTQELLQHFPNAQCVMIHHYKDVFNRRGQNYALQHSAQNLILAKKHGTFIYAGAPVCQSFGNQHFYYTSCVMNCVYDCDYCYLKGMYPSGNLVVFLNLDEVFAELEQILQEHPVYLCVSYDTDLLALEHLLGYVKRWIDFTAVHEMLTIEIRTKSGRLNFSDFIPCERVIFAYTISPHEVIAQYEHNTASLKGRVESAAAAMQAGFPVRFCFDPMIFLPQWERIYQEMLAYIDTVQIRGERIWTKLYDVSVGTFRISQDYLKNMRKNYPASAVTQYPYENDGGVYSYGELGAQMEQLFVKWLTERINQDRIFLWKNNEKGDA